MFHRLYAHIVWTTRDRAPLIDATLARFLCRILRVLARKEHSIVLEVGIVSTHVHVLVRIHPTTSLTSLVKRMKGASSALATKEGYPVEDAPLYWAKGYGVHSVSVRNLERVRTYLRAQPLHHPAEALADWEGDTAAEYDTGSMDALIADQQSRDRNRDSAEGRFATRRPTIPMSVRTSRGIATACRAATSVALAS